ncbi:hypothetical protein AGABI2DRAFT_225744 [Agaricus bisporus var. bisporus H97]|uniref:hypothetical protein n=1 Tax=Agaricus bisporus var. bisporus (strain H97 / ATCC MYA-4626 / FGSC 10389) TaxID=936046 RepID=UPI00029F52DC|nr:hypothetical protein AGABI2DRAFT_225744 [Agaricus bisporus var. bisporus H97]EKV44497.1 hypothetical protein AGABI2DRAFT_225744 [Agaricus bisporus var. bisporus H97]
MDMHMNMTSGAHAGMMMVPFFHFAGGDFLLFEAWKPTSGGAIGGACVGIFFFAMFERLVHAFSPALLLYFAPRRPRSAIESLRDHTSSPDHSSKASDISMKEEGRLSPRTTPLFVFSVDVPRGFIHGFQRLLGFILMLVAMTFHAGYILSIIFGLTLGEILFGRIAYRVVKDVGYQNTT